MNRPPDPLFDRRVADWLETDPNDAPRQALDTVLAAFPSIPQRRRAPWRYPIMTNPLRLAAAAFVGVLVVGALYFGLPRITGIGGPGPTQAPSRSLSPGPSPTTSPVTAGPSPTPLDPTTWTSYASARHGYSIKHPGDWTTTPATAPWTYADISTDDAAVFDHLEAASSPGFEIVGTSTKIPPGMSEDDWLAAYRQPVVDAYGAGCFPPRAQWTAVVVGGHPGGLYEGCLYVESMTFLGGRAYVFTVSVKSGFVIDDSLRTLFRTILSTVTLDPTAADDTPVPASSTPSLGPAPS